MGGTVFRSAAHAQNRFLAFADDVSRLVAFRGLEEPAKTIQRSLITASDSGENGFDGGGARGDDTATGSDEPSDETGDPLVATAISIVATAALLGSMVIAYVLGRVLAK